MLGHGALGENALGEAGGQSDEDTARETYEFMRQRYGASGFRAWTDLHPAIQAQLIAQARYMREIGLIQG